MADPTYWPSVGAPGYRQDMAAHSWQPAPGDSGIPPVPAYDPARPPATPAAMPGAITRSREELEKLRDDANAQMQMSGLDRAGYTPWLDPRHAGAGLMGVLETAQWLLGEREIAPISKEWYAYPYTAREVGRERTHSLDRVFGYAWEDVPEWYAAGVQNTLDWAMGRTKPGSLRDRPIFED